MQRHSFPSLGEKENSEAGTVFSHPAQVLAAPVSTKPPSHSLGITGHLAFPGRLLSAEAASLLTMGEPLRPQDQGNLRTANSLYPMGQFNLIVNLMSSRITLETNLWTYLAGYLLWAGLSQELGPQLNKKLSWLFLVIHLTTSVIN